MHNTTLLPMPPMRGRAGADDDDDNDDNGAMGSSPLVLVLAPQPLAGMGAVGTVLSAGGIDSGDGGTDDEGASVDGAAAVSMAPNPNSAAASLCSSMPMPNPMRSCATTDAIKSPPVMLPEVTPTNRAITIVRPTVSFSFPTIIG
jgi:hypothetical protein